MRKDTGALMDSIYDDLKPYIEQAEFPTWLPQKLGQVGMNGL